MPRPSAGRRRFVESIIHDAFAQRPQIATTRRVAPPVTSPSLSAAAIAWSDAARAEAFAAWIGRVAARHGIVAATLRPASSDASFRRYMRADRTGGGSVWVKRAVTADRTRNRIERVLDFAAVRGHLAETAREIALQLGAP